MLDTAIIGGGLCGLALARSLSRHGRPAALFEARARLGGRILTVQDGTSGLSLDLGPTWFWPQSQPLVSSLIAETELADIPQHDEGVVLHLRDPDKRAEEITNRQVHGDARRLEAGMERLVEALAQDLPSARTYLDHVLTRVTDRGDHVALTFRVGDHTVSLEARCVVLALPPRLLDESVRFEPELSEAVRDAMRGTETWMAARAKVMVTYPRALWRDTGLSGNAFVTHEQAVIGEVFDACDAAAEKAALGGFLALTPQLRQAFSAGLPMLMDNQLMQLFGADAEGGAQYYQDWASEPFTCSARDRDATIGTHSDTGNPLLRRALWGGRLHIGGSETAAQGAGYLEGALDAARRIERALTQAWAAQSAHARAEGHFAEDLDDLGDEPALAAWRAWVALQGPLAFDDYRRRVTHALAAQQREQITQRAILAAAETTFANALVKLGTLPLDRSGAHVERGRSSLTPLVQQPFGAFMQSLMDDVTAFNRTSCALSNFPDEHQLSKDYVQAILRDIAAAWQEFSRAANRLLLPVTQPEHGLPADARGDPRTDRPASGLSS
ncbi:flavin monoamine oxidase family protein [Roseixanthobacter pseudopolyaromaticivorans]|uniref:flavin monoamine oxidase family protein n=1 Tax=Xanthobacteraceae TaxID=335928 RepID=UPI003729ACC9